MAVVNQQDEDDNNHGAGGSRSSIDELARVSVSTEAKLELMMRIYKNTICPMILAEINAKQQKFLSLIREKFGMDLLTSMTWKCNDASITLGSQALQLKFLNGISTPVSTGMNIKGKDHKPFVVALVDGISGNIVTTGAVAAMEVEIVVLEGDCNNDEEENWTSDEFNNKIISKWNGKKVLQGKTFLNLKEGIVSIDKISFTHNAAWKGNKNCRLGAKCADPVIGTIVKEAITESFLVRDKRNLLYNKHEIPSLSDPVYRLYMISRHGDCFNRLMEASIKTVMDLRTIHAINPQRLKDLLGVRPSTWKVITNHAKMCKDDKGIYLYHHPRDGQKKDGVVFNIYGELVGLIVESQLISSDKLPNDKKAAAQKLIKSSSEHWEEVLSFNDEASLSNYVQSGPTLNLLSNGLSLVIPQKHDQISLTCPQVMTPIFHTNNGNWGYRDDSVGVMSPKRPAPEFSISNSPKKPRDDHHPQMSPSTPSVGSSSVNLVAGAYFNQCEKPNNYLFTPDPVGEDWMQYHLELPDLFSPDPVGEDWMQYHLELPDLFTPDPVEEDCMQYLNPLQLDRWKMVWCVVGWISVFSKVRKR